MPGRSPAMTRLDWNVLGRQRGISKGILCAQNVSRNTESQSTASGLAKNLLAELMRIYDSILCGGCCVAAMSDGCLER